MQNSIAAFLDDWTRERASTLKVIQTLTDASLSQRVSPEGRTLGFLAWHVVLSLVEMGGKAGLAVDKQAEDAPEPETAAEIASAYEAASTLVADQVRLRWTDAMLADKLDLYGSTWTRGAVLDSLIKHQIHHRAQMTVLMRQAGLAVPGIYGPAREEWARMGMPPKR